MANMLDEATTHTIQRIVKYCDGINKKPEAFLCMGSQVYRTAIQSIRNAGIWSVDIAVIGFIIELVMIYNSPITTDYRILLTVVGIIAILVSGNFALRLYNFKTTATSSLVYAILSGIIACFAVPWGAVPFVLLPTIIALIRWSTYRNWFNDMKAVVAEHGENTIMTRIMWSDLREDARREEVKQKKNNKPDPEVVKLVSRLRKQGVTDRDIVNIIRAERNGAPQENKGEKEAKKEEDKVIDEYDDDLL